MSLSKGENLGGRREAFPAILVLIPAFSQYFHAYELHRAIIPHFGDVAGLDQNER